MPISTISQAGLNAPITLTSPVIAGTPTGVGVLTSGTAVASTSGTAINFTDIPSWVKRITVMVAGISTNGTSLIQIQVGSGSVSTSGYASQASASTSGSGVVTTGLVIVQQMAAVQTYSGAAVLTLLGSNTWVCFGFLAYVAGTSTGPSFGGTTPALGGTLDRIRITTVNGTDTFDAGSVNILYE
jgi:hypothetical protein